MVSLYVPPHLSPFDFHKSAFAPKTRLQNGCKVLCELSTSSIVHDVRATLEVIWLPWVLMKRMVAEGKSSEIQRSRSYQQLIRR